jgi:hypothetical protein
VIDSALFFLVLDDYEETDINDAASNMLHGKYLFGFRSLVSDLPFDDGGYERSFSHFLLGLFSLLQFFQVPAC